MGRFTAPAQVLSRLGQSTSVIKGLFGTVSLHKTQLSSVNFIMKQLNLKVGKVNYFVWLAYQLQLHKNKILVGIVPYAIEMMF
jgi:hypothetical protein